MAGTSIRISDNTYKMVIRTKGILEQMFQKNLSIDDTAYLSSRLICFIYQEFQKLTANNLITLTQKEDGKLAVSGLPNIIEIVPEIVEEMMEINKKLAEKESKAQSVPAIAEEE